MNVILGFILTLCCVFSSHATRTELVLWHGMAGQLGEEVRALADGFNQSQKAYTIVPVYKGDYVETLTSFAAAYRAKKPPQLVQVFEVGTNLMLSPKGIIKPVDVLMREQKVTLPKDDFIPSVRAFYSRNGQLMAMPFNLSAPVLYFNQAALTKAGFDADHLPKTWGEFEVLARALKKQGYECTYTTAYPGWILVESYLAIHGLPMDPMRLKGHLNRLKRWQDNNYFRYGGRVDDASVLFTSGVCPLFSQSSGAYNSLKALVPFPLGVMALPLDTTASSTRHPNVAGGAALWAVAGLSENEYRGIAQFFAYLARPETQSQWHAHTGYLPLGLTGSYVSITTTSNHPALNLAKDDLQASRGADHVPTQQGPQNQIRAVFDEILESVFSGEMSTDEALTEAQSRIDHVLERFLRNTGQ